MSDTESKIEAVDGDDCPRCDDGQLETFGGEIVACDSCELRYEQEFSGASKRFELLAIGGSIIGLVSSVAMSAYAYYMIEIRGLTPNQQAIIENGFQYPFMEMIDTAVLVILSPVAFTLMLCVCLFGILYYDRQQRRLRELREADLFE